MGKVGLPRGLIAYDTDKNIACRKEGKKASFNLIRPRVILYSAELALVGAIMLFGLTTRATIDLLAYAVMLPLLVWLSYALFHHLSIGYLRGERTGQSAWNPPVWPFRIVFFAAFALLALQVLAELAKTLRTLRTGAR